MRLSSKNHGPRTLSLTRGCLSTVAAQASDRGFRVRRAEARGEEGCCCLAVYTYLPGGTGRSGMLGGVTPVQRNLDTTAVEAAPCRRGGDVSV